MFYTQSNKKKIKSCEGYQGGYVKHVTWYYFRVWKFPPRVVIPVVSRCLLFCKWSNHRYHQTCIAQQ